MRNFLTRNFLFIFILLFAGFLSFWQLGETKLTNWDEAWYADVSHTMAETGNFIIPMWNSKPFYEKPPLFFWLTAIAMKIFGESEFSARLISALSAIATVGLVFAFAEYRWGRIIAFISSLVLISMPAYLYRVRTGNIDSLFTFLIFLQVFFFFQLKKTRPMWWMFGIATGLAVLTKGVLGLLFPIVATFFLLLRKEHRMFVYLIKAVILGVGIVCLWSGMSFIFDHGQYLVGLVAHQQEKLSFTKTLLERLSLSYIGYLRSGMKFWFLIFIASLVYSFIRWKKNTLFVLSLFVILFLFFLSLAETQSNWFLLPLYPVVAIIIGGTIFELTKRFASKNVLVYGGIIAISVFQLIHYRSEYFVADIAKSEAEVALASQRFTLASDVIYLTHYYFPTAVYYSRRTTYAVYSEQTALSWWILPKTAWNEILLRDRVFINTDKIDLSELERLFPRVRFEVIFESGDKLLVKKTS